MSRSTISTFKVFEMFPDAETARLYLESRLWPNGPVCPVCNSGERIGTRKAGFYRCNACPEDFTVRTGTIFERSHIPLHKWIYAMYLMVTARKSVSSLQIAKEIGITQKSAWFMMHRVNQNPKRPCPGKCGDTWPSSELCIRCGKCFYCRTHPEPLRDQSETPEGEA